MQLNKLVKSLAIVISMFTLAACSTSDTDTSEGNMVDTNQTGTDLIQPTEPVDVMTEEELRNQALRQSQTIYFNFDDIEINSEFAEMLGAHAAFLRANVDVNVTVEGHADERGTPEYNIALGERRANAVAKYLEVLGVSSDQISIVSYGEEKPIKFGHTDEDYQMNRRAVLVY